MKQNHGFCDRPSLQTVFDKVVAISNTPFVLPKTTNKGAPGLYLEERVGIPTSSACLDCEDGEVKMFPIKQLKNNSYVPKESVAVTMLNTETLETQSFEESRCFRKLSRVLYVPYYRQNDIITYLHPTIIDLASHEHRHLFMQLKKDYDDIRSAFLQNEKTGLLYTLEGTSKIGKYLQNRTKGAGKGSPKTRAYYLRPAFIKDNVPIYVSSNNW